MLNAGRLVCNENSISPRYAQKVRIHNAAVYEGSLDETDREDIRERAAAAADIQHPDGAASVRSCVTPFSGKAIARSGQRRNIPLVVVCADTHVHSPPSLSLTQSRSERCAPKADHED